VHVFAHDELERADQRSFECRDIHLAIALRGMTVADLELCSGCEYRNEQLRARHQLAIVHVPVMHRGRRRAYAVQALRLGDSHTAEERAQRDFDSSGEAGHTRPAPSIAIGPVRMWPPGPFAVTLAMDVAQGLLHLPGGKSGSFEQCGAGCGQRVDLDLSPDRICSTEVVAS
jgi:hypothetical protein